MIRNARKMDFEIAPSAQGKRLREAFLTAFVDTAGSHFRDHIAALRPCADGLFYDGYLWDCLLDNNQWRKECRMEDAAKFLAGKESVYAMWDLFPRDRIAGRLPKECPRDAVIKTRGELLGQMAVDEWDQEQAAWRAGCQCQALWLPEDLYCFDGSLEWYVIFTHEGWDQMTNPELGEDDYIRVCFLHAPDFRLPAAPQNFPRRQLCKN